MPDNHNDICRNPQITDGVPQGSSHTLEPGFAAVNAHLEEAQLQEFANMVNEQAQHANIAAATLTQELSQLFSLDDDTK
jgi:hypothetical protein